MPALMPWGWTEKRAEVSAGWGRGEKPCGSQALSLVLNLISADLCPVLAHLVFLTHLPRGQSSADELSSQGVLWQNPGALRSWVRAEGSTLWAAAGRSVSPGPCDRQGHGS